MLKLATVWKCWLVAAAAAEVPERCSVPRERPRIYAYGCQDTSLAGYCGPRSLMARTPDGCEGTEWLKYGACQSWAEEATVGGSTRQFECWKHEPEAQLPSAQDEASPTWHPVDGGSGRVCRGQDEQDDSEDYYEVHHWIENKTACKELCAQSADCTGIEYWSLFNYNSCEVWKVPIQSSAYMDHRRRTPASDTSRRRSQGCWRYEPFQPIDQGLDRACRGNDRLDNAASNFQVHSGVASLQDCQAKCASAVLCTGVEYLAEYKRCEVWTSIISATVPAAGYQCWRFIPWLDEERSDQALATAAGARCVPTGSCSAKQQPATSERIENEATTPEACKELCAARPSCVGMDFSGPVSSCRQSSNLNATCRLRLLDSETRRAAVQPTAGPPLKALEQPGAPIPAGGEVRLFAVGSSNTEIQTWVDQFHRFLRQLGYQTPVIDACSATGLHPSSAAPSCDDEAEYTFLQTPRIYQGGWSSWGYAYESLDDCDSGFRVIAGHNVSCINGPGCNDTYRGPRLFFNVSQLADDASQSNVTVLSNWVNDPHQWGRNPDCFAGVNPGDGISDIIVASLKRIIREIHARQSHVVVAVIALYPYEDVARPGFLSARGLSWAEKLNAGVREGLRSEPNVVWVQPNYDITDVRIVQAKFKGHFNCRGDRLLASSLVEALFDAGVLGRGLALGPSECLVRSDCAALAAECCQRSVLCRVSAAGACVPYSTGEITYVTK